MIEILVAALSSWVTPSRLVSAIAAAALAGVVRGFSGFGSALPFIPAMAAIYDPQTAAATLVLIDLLGSARQTIAARRNCQPREVLSLTAAALVGALGGTAALSYVEPFILRCLASATVLIVLGLVLAKYRYQGTPNELVTTAVGLLSGFLGGAVAMEGPPAVLFWLSGPNTRTVTRANVMMFIALTELMVLLLYVLFGLVTVRILVLAAILLPFFWVSFLIGDRKFHGTSDKTYRVFAGVVIFLSAIASLFIHNS